MARARGRVSSRVVGRVKNASAWHDFSRKIIAPRVDGVDSVPIGIVTSPRGIERASIHRDLVGRGRVRVSSASLSGLASPARSREKNPPGGLSNDRARACGGGEERTSAIRVRVGVGFVGQE